MNRSDHLQWAKDRAIDILNSGDIAGSYASFMSDMLKYDELSDHLALELGTMLLLSGFLTTDHQIREWMLGFN